jgi:hypothetical protein
LLVLRVLLASLILFQHDWRYNYSRLLLSLVKYYSLLYVCMVLKDLRLLMRLGLIRLVEIVALSLAYHRGFFILLWNFDFFLLFFQRLLFCLLKIEYLS